MHFAPWRVAGFLTVAIWTYLALFRGAFWRLRERVKWAEPQAVHSVTAIVPARDESEFIERAVASLHAQTVPLKVIVADDESTDSTGAASRADFVVRVESRPPGWKGKLWAVASGLRAETANPEYFLLTDADIEHVSPDLAASLLAQAEKGFDLVSVMVQLRCESLAEQLLIPAFVFFFFKLYPPAWVAAGKSAAAAGGCMLIRNEMLAKIGGIESIHDALIDDCSLAARVASCGGKVWMGISDLPIRSIRPYGGITGIRSMIARSAFAQLRHSVVLLAGTIAAMLLTYVAPVVLLFSHDVVAVMCGFAAWLLSAVLFVPTLRIYRAPVWMAACLPAIALFYLAATIESAIRYWTGTGGLWKGRTQDKPA